MQHFSINKSQHRGLTKERWSSFSTAEQILMIANEMNRAKRLFSPLDKNGLTLCYERVLYLTDLAIQLNSSRGLRKEILRWRDCVAKEYICSIAAEGSLEQPDINRHLKIFKSLLLLSIESAEQVPYLMPIAQRGLETSRLKP
ncbi:MAG: hypothetical protein HY265_02275 [Deltaproteobacteria bacterium]|nr:hypothetical protein [Deltaproteobacteria bacterium]